MTTLVRPVHTLGAVLVGFLIVVAAAPGQEPPRTDLPLDSVGEAPPAETTDGEPEVGTTSAVPALDLSRPTIGLPINLPQIEEIKDPVFAILVGLVNDNLYGTLTRDRLQMQLESTGQKSHLPYRSVLEVTRLPAGDGRPTGEVQIRFEGKLKLAIPYSILGYNPGSFRASEECRFREWDLGTFTIHHARKKGDEIEQVPVVLEDAHLFGLEEGEVSLDIDAWVDRLFGGSLDDTDIVGLMLCRYEGRWIGLAMGYNKDRRGRSGALDFKEDKVIFPSPDEMKTVGRTMRGRVEGLLRAVRDR